MGACGYCSVVASGKMSVDSEVDLSTKEALDKIMVDAGTLRVQAVQLTHNNSAVWDDYWAMDPKAVDHTGRTWAEYLEKCSDRAFWMDELQLAAAAAKLKRMITVVYKDDRNGWARRTLGENHMKRGWFVLVLDAGHFRAVRPTAAGWPEGLADDVGGNMPYRGRGGGRSGPPPPSASSRARSRPPAGARRHEQQPSSPTTAFSWAAGSRASSRGSKGTAARARGPAPRPRATTSSTPLPPSGHDDSRVGGGRRRRGGVGDAALQSPAFSWITANSDAADAAQPAGGPGRGQAGSRTTRARSSAAFSWLSGGERARAAAATQAGGHRASSGPRTARAPRAWSTAAFSWLSGRASEGSVATGQCQRLVRSKTTLAPPTVRRRPASRARLAGARSDDQLAGEEFETFLCSARAAYSNPQRALPVDQKAEMDDLTQDMHTWLATAREGGLAPTREEVNEKRCHYDAELLRHTLAYPLRGDKRLPLRMAPQPGCGLEDQ